MEGLSVEVGKKKNQFGSGPLSLLLSSHLLLSRSYELSGLLAVRDTIANLGRRRSFRDLNLSAALSFQAVCIERRAVGNVSIVRSRAEPTYHLELVRRGDSSGEYCSDSQVTGLRLRRSSVVMALITRSHSSHNNNNNNIYYYFYYFY